LIVLVLGLVGWGGLARIIRGFILSARELDYAAAAKALGASEARVLWRHLLPSTASYVIVNLTLAIPGYILGETSLSFLGLGPSWGMDAGTPSTPRSDAEGVGNGPSVFP